LRKTREAKLSQIGDRTPGDEGFYPADDIQAKLAAPGQWIFSRKDGAPC
jgi:hypothetical protein